MSRSKWKGPILNLIFKKKSRKKEIIYANRSSFILPKLLDTDVQIYNGKTYSEISIERDMIGHSFGEFSFTRAKFIFKKKKKKSR